jgi:hypothetical protein
MCSLTPLFLGIIDVVFLLVVSKVAMFTLEAETKSHECILQTTKLIILVLTLQNVAFQEE